MATIKPLCALHEWWKYPSGEGLSQFKKLFIKKFLTNYQTKLLLKNKLYSADSNY